MGCYWTHMPLPDPRFFQDLMTTISNIFVKFHEFSSRPNTSKKVSINKQNKNKRVLLTLGAWTLNTVVRNLLKVVATSCSVSWLLRLLCYLTVWFSVWMSLELQIEPDYLSFRESLHLTFTEDSRIIRNSSTSILFVVSWFYVKYYKTSNCLLHTSCV